ncbi:MAG: hypothetical protein OHK0029_00730 [Armatimonadaceae bacterium]
MSINSGVSAGRAKAWSRVAIAGLAIASVAVIVPMVRAQDANTPKTVQETDSRNMPRSLSGFNSMMKTIKENAEKRAKAAGKNEKEVEEVVEEAGEIYEALRYHIQMRAFPYDSVNPNIYVKALERVKQMPKASFGKQATRPGQSTTPGPVRILSGAGGAGGSAGQWTFIGPNRLATPYQIYYGPPGSYTSGRVNGVAYDPSTPGTIYLSGAQGGVWKSTDNGQTWTCVSNADNWPYPQYVTPVAVHPTNGTVYAGTGDFNTGAGGANATGLLASSDGGATWTPLPSIAAERAKLAGQCVSAIVVDPDNPSIITIATGRGSSGGGVWRSTDGGQTWNRAAGTGNGAWSGLERCVPGGVLGPVYVACAIGDGLYFSTNQGVNWQRITNLPLAFNNPVTPSGGLGLRIGASKNQPGVVYVFDASATALDGRIFRGVLNSTGTWDWRDITGNFPSFTGDVNTFSQASYDLHITAVRQNLGGVPGDMVYGGAINLNASALGSTDWTDISFTLTPQALIHNDQHSFAENPHEIYRAMAGNDGGIYGVIYNPFAGSWSYEDRLSATLGITQFYKADWDASDWTLIIGGTQDNATPLANGDLSRWANVGGGDGGGCAINLLNPNIQYTTSQNGTIYRTTNRWNTSGLIAVSDNFWDNTDVVTQASEPPFIGELSVSQAPGRAGFMYYGTQYLWRWSETSGWLTDTSDPPKIKPMGDEQLADDGAFITSITVANRGMFQSNGSPLRVQIGELLYTVTEGNVVYVGTSDGQLWMTRNALDTDVDADHDITWISLNVPTLPTGVITSVTVNPNNAADILVTVNNGATGGGVYRCTNTNSPAPVFTPRNGFGASQLPGAPVNDLSVSPEDPTNTWYVATDIGVFMTTDGGANWLDATLPLGLPQVECTAIEVMPVQPDGTSCVNVATYGRGMWRLPLTNIQPIQLDYGGRLVRSGNTIRMEGSIINRGRQINSLVLQSVTLQVDRGATVNANGTFPSNIGNVAEGAVLPRNFVFNTGSVRPGSSVTYIMNFTYQGSAQPYQIIQRTRVR